MNKFKHKLKRFEVFTAVTMKNGVFLDVMPCGSWKNRRFEELSASFIRVTRICELGTTLAVTSNQVFRIPDMDKSRNPVILSYTIIRSPYIIVLIILLLCVWHSIILLMAETTVPLVVGNKYRYIIPGYYIAVSVTSIASYLQIP
jgi:hypothetical protein